MDYVEYFGKTLDSLVDKHPNRSRDLLEFGWGLMNLKFKALPDRRLCSADRYLAYVMMDIRLQGEAQYCASLFLRQYSFIYVQRVVLNHDGARFNPAW